MGCGSSKSQLSTSDSSSKQLTNTTNTVNVTSKDDSQKEKVESQRENNVKDENETNEEGVDNKSPKEQDNSRGSGNASSDLLLSSGEKTPEALKKKSDAPYMSIMFIDICDNGDIKCEKESAPIIDFEFTETACVNEEHKSESSSALLQNMVKLKEKEDELQEMINENRKDLLSCSSEPHIVQDAASTQEDRCAAVIQANFRGHLVRQSLKHEREASHCDNNGDDVMT